jgi:hypothetical protein
VPLLGAAQQADLGRMVLHQRLASYFDQDARWLLGNIYLLQQPGQERLIFVGKGLAHLLAPGVGVRRRQPLD